MNPFPSRISTPSLIYTATITSASIRLRESRIVADLLIQAADEAGWRAALYDDDVLQLGNPVSIGRIGRLIRARLAPLGADIWRMVRDGERAQATQAVLAGAIHNSRLLGDFMDITMREQRSLFATKLESRMWNDYVGNCRGRDPDMPQWSDATIARLRSAVFGMLAESGYLMDTRSLVLQNVFVDTELADCLRSIGENYVLRCMEVAE